MQSSGYHEIRRPRRETPSPLAGEGGVRGPCLLPLTSRHTHASRPRSPKPCYLAWRSICQGCHRKCSHRLRRTGYAIAWRWLAAGRADRITHQPARDRRAALARSRPGSSVSCREMGSAHSTTSFAICARIRIVGLESRTHGHSAHEVGCRESVGRGTLPAFG